MTLANHLPFGHLLFVPARHEAGILESRHHLIERRPALADARLLETRTKETPARRAAQNLDDDEKLEMRESWHRA